MSEVILDTITGKSTATTITIGSTPVVSASANSMTIKGEGSNQTSIQQGLTKTWANLNGTSFGLRDSFNIGSATDRATGRYTFTKTTNMSNVNYSVTYSQNPHNATSGGVTHIVGFGEGGNGNHSTSEYQAECGVLNNGSDVDADVFTMVAGDLS